MASMKYKTKAADENPEKRTATPEVKKGTKTEAPADPKPKEGGAETPAPEEMHARHMEARKAMHKRHETESRDMHGNHREERRKMHARHDEEMQAMNSQQADEMGAGAAPAAPPETGAAPAGPPAPAAPGM